MTEQELFVTLKERFREIVEDNGLLDRELKVACRALSPEEAIGNTKRKDYPILNGKEVMMQAEFEGGIGQSFTDTPAAFSGTLAEVLDLDILHNTYERNIFIAALNAVMRKLGMCDRSIHCRDNGPEECAEKITDTLMKTYGPDVRIAQIGYQPAMLAHLAEKFEVRVLDLNPANVGEIRCGVKVLDGVKDYAETVQWADLILCTGSTLGNGTIVNFINLDKEVLYYGTSAAGAAELLGLKRICHAL